MHDDVSNLVLEAIQKSPKPLDAKKIGGQLPKLYRPGEARVAEILAGLVGDGKVFSWGANRFAAVRPAESARSALQQAVGEPKSASEVCRSAAKYFPFTPATARDKQLKEILAELAKGGAIKKYNRCGVRYGALDKKPSFAAALAKLQADYADIAPEEWEAALRSAFALPTPQRIQKAVLTVQPKASEGAVAWLPAVRAALAPPVGKAEFDRTVLELSRGGVFSLHEFRGHLQVSSDEREALVFDGKDTYYGGVTFVR